MDHGILGSGRDIPGSDRDILGLNRDTVDSGGCSKDLGVGAADCNTAEGNSLGGRLSGSGERNGWVQDEAEFDNKAKHNLSNLHLHQGRLLRSVAWAYNCTIWSQNFCLSALAEFILRSVCSKTHSYS